MVERERVRGEGMLAPTSEEAGKGWGDRGMGNSIWVKGLKGKEWGVRHYS